MFYKSFFYECLVNLYFKKKSILGGFQGQKYSFKNTYTYLVTVNTYGYLKNLSIDEILIRFSIKFKI